MDAREGSTKHQVTSGILCEFLEVAIHSILYTRELYPPGVFQRRKKYNVPVQISYHPALKEYISELIKSLDPLILERRVERVDIVILGGDSTVLERFVFEIHESRMDSRNGHSLLQLEQELRAFLLKLNISDALLSPLPKDCSWTIQVHTRESAAISMQDREHVQGFTWIPADQAAQHISCPTLTPLKSTNSGLLKMQLYVEESDQKSSR